MNKGLRESQPHHVNAEHLMIKILQKVYQEETKQEPTLLSTGGCFRCSCCLTNLLFSLLKKTATLGFNILNCKKIDS